MHSPDLEEIIRDWNKKEINVPKDALRTTEQIVKEVLKKLKRKLK